MEYNKVYLYLCNKAKRILSGKCNGAGCIIFGQCNHTIDERFAKNPKDKRWFEFYLIGEKEPKELYIEVEKEN